LRGSRSSESASLAEKYPEVTVIGENVVEVMRGLKSEEGEGGKDVYLMCGSELAGQLMKEGLVDSAEVAIMPVILGAGTKLLSAGDKQEP